MATQIDTQYQGFGVLAPQDNTLYNQGSFTPNYNLFNYSNPTGYGVMLPDTTSNNTFNFGFGNTSLFDNNYSSKASSSNKSKTTKTKKDKEKKKLSASQREKLKEVALLAGVTGAGTLGGALAGSAVFGVPTLLSTKFNPTSTLEMFYASSGNKAKYDALFKQNPNLMEEAQKAMQKLENRFAKDIKRAGKGSTLATQLEQEFQLLQNEMRTALNSGKLKDISIATEKINAAARIKNGWLARTFRGIRGKEIVQSRSSAAAAADLSKVKIPKSGTKLLHNFGGISGFIGAPLMLGLSILMDRNKLEEAKKMDKNNPEQNIYGKQLKQTGFKALLSFLGWTGGDIIGKTIVKKLAAKSAGKIAAKIAAKGLGKATGAAIGSICPGLGTIAGIAIGAVVDWAISKWVIPAIFGKNDAVQVAKVDNMTDEQLLSAAQEVYASGKELDKNTERTILGLTDKANKSELKRLHNLTGEKRKELEAQQKLLLQQQQKQQQNLKLSA